MSFLLKICNESIIIKESSGMQRILQMICVLLMLFGFNPLFAQLKESPIKIFGYFQNEFEYQKGTGDSEEPNEN